jgi:hypothetical protein
VENYEIFTVDGYLLFFECEGLKNLLCGYWIQKEGENPNHLSDAQIFDGIVGVVIGLLVIKGLIAIHG